MAATDHLAMSWDEWAAYDGIALAERVRTGDIRADEVVAQAVAGVHRVDGTLQAGLEVFEDVAADPLADDGAVDGRLHGVPIF